MNIPNKYFILSEDDFFVANVESYLVNTLGVGNNNVSDPSDFDDHILNHISTNDVVIGHKGSGFPAPSCQSYFLLGVKDGVIDKDGYKPIKHFVDGLRTPA